MGSDGPHKKVAWLGDDGLNQNTDTGGSERLFSPVTNSPEPAGFLVPAVVVESGKLEVGQDSTVLLTDGTALNISPSVPVLLWKRAEGAHAGYWTNYPLRVQEGQKVFLVTKRTPQGELRILEVRIREEKRLADSP